MSKLFEWKSDEWYVDKYGQLKLREAYDDEIEMTVLRPVYIEEESGYILEEVES